MTTDTTEKGLERIICIAMAGHACEPAQGGAVAERPANYGVGWIGGDPQDYDREYCVDLAQLSAFLHDTQPVAAEPLDLGQGSPTRRKFLARLQGEVAKRGTIDVLRKGVKHGPHQIDLMYGTPSPGNEKAGVQYGQNRFSVTRQLHYSQDNTQLALDLCLFINGLPVATFELKNSLTKQTVADAVKQYRKTATLAKSSSSWGAALSTSPSTITRCSSVLTYRGRDPGSCPSTRGGTTARAILPIPTESRPITCGSRSLPGKASPTSLRTTPKLPKPRTTRAGIRSGSRYGPATTSWTWCGGS